jgi:hypothetical protein
MLTGNIITLVLCSSRDDVSEITDMIRFRQDFSGHKFN